MVGLAGHLPEEQRKATFHTFGGPRRRPALASARQGRRIYFNSQDHEPKARLFQAICVGQVIVMPVEHTKKIAGDWLGSHTCVTNNRFTSTGTIDHQLFFGVTG